MLLSVILGNWTRLRNIAGFTNENLDQIRQMKNSRNRWSHLPTEDIENYSPIGIDRDYFILDLANMRILIRAISDDHPVIDKIEAFMQGLHNNSPTLPEPIALPIEHNGHTDRPLLEEFRKLSRIRLWAERPHQDNHKIISAFLYLEKKGEVLLRDFKRICTSESEFLQFYVPTFDGHYPSMKTDAGNSHGKVFYDQNGIVLIWPRVREEIETYFI